MKKHWRFAACSVVGLVVSVLTFNAGYETIAVLSAIATVWCLGALDAEVASMLKQRGRER